MPFLCVGNFRRVLCDKILKVSTTVNPAIVTSKAGARSILKSSGDWRTLIIAVLVYVGWFASVFTHKQLPWWATFALLTWFGAWHLSLQHELVHGHPFRNSKLNAALASLSVTMWVPFLSFKRDHISHHNTTRDLLGQSHIGVSLDRLVGIQRCAIFHCRRLARSTQCWQRPRRMVLAHSGTRGSHIYSHQSGRHVNGRISNRWGFRLALTKHDAIVC